MPQVAVPTAAIKFSLDFNPKTHQFVVVISDVESSEYTIEYAASSDIPEDTTSVTQALTGQVKADITRQIRLELLAGTESSNQKVLHQFKEGVLRLTAQTTSGQSVSMTQFFSLDAQQRLQLAEFSQEIAPGQVLGESTQSTASAESVLQASPSTTTLALMPEAVMATPTASNSSPVLWWLFFGSILISVASGSVWWWLRWRHRAV